MGRTGWDPFSISPPDDDPRVGPADAADATDEAPAPDGGTDEPAAADEERLTGPDVWGTGAARPRGWHGPADEEPGSATGPEPPRRPARPTRARRRVDLSGVARQSYAQFIGTAANAVFTFALVILAAHTLGRGGTGALYVGIAVFIIATNLAELGADTGLLRMIPHFRTLRRVADLRRLIAIALVPVLVISTAMAVLLLRYAPQLADLLGHGHADDVLPYLRVFAGFLPLAALSSVALTGSRGFGTVAPFVSIENVGKPAARVVLLAVVTSLGLGTTAVALSWSVPILIGAAIGVPWLFLLLRREERRARRHGLRLTDPGPISRIAGEFWRFASPRAFMGFFSTTITWIDTVLLASLRSTADAGVYIAATRLTVPGTMALTALIAVISPQLARFLARDEDRPEAQRLYHTATAWLVAVAWPFYVVLLWFAPLFLSMFGARFVSGAAVTELLAVGCLVTTAVGPVGAVVLMGGHSLWGLFFAVVSLTLNIALNLVLIPRYGMVGAAIAWDVSIVVNSFAPLILASTLMRIAPFGRGFLVAAGASLAVYGGLGAITRLAFGTAVVPFLVYLVVATAIYAILLLRFHRALRIDALVEALPLSSRASRRAERWLRHHGRGADRPQPAI